jgi:hypothetical protein
MSYNHLFANEKLDQIPVQSEIKKLWQIKRLDDHSVLELRAINGPQIISKVFHAPKYASENELKTAFEEEALRLNKAGYNIYYVMNKIREDFICGSAKDKDISYRELLLIDIDKVGHKGESSTDEELKAALVLGEQITEYLKSESWGDPIRMMSGNGCHLYYHCSKIPNDEKTKSLVEGVLHELAVRFNNSVVEIDTVVYNASRVTKVPGTIARKGPNTAERPHRMAVVL